MGTIIVEKQHNKILQSIHFTHCLPYHRKHWAVCWTDWWWLELRYEDLKDTLPLFGAGSLMTDQPYTLCTWQADSAAAAAGVWFCLIWYRIWIFTTMSFLLYSGGAVCLKQLCGFLNLLAPWVSVSSCGFPFFMVYSTRDQTFLEHVFVSLVLASNIAEPWSQFTEKGNIWESVVFHSGHMAGPTKLYFQEHCLNADALRSFHNFNVGDVVIPFYLQYSSETALVEAFQEADVTAEGTQDSELRTY